VFRTFGNAIRLIVAHPTIFAAAIPLLLWKGTALSLDLPQSSDEAITLQQFVADLPATLLFEPLAAGLAISFAAEASRGRASWTRSVRCLLPKVPRLLALYAVLAGLGAVVLIVWPHVPRLSAPHWILVPFGLLLLWLCIRLALVQVALLVDDIGIRGAIARSWALTNGNAWRVFGLAFLTSLLPFPISWFWPSVHFAIETLMSPVLDTVLVLAHRGLASASSSNRSVAGPRPLQDPSPA
jgi:hypothetical protein